MQVHHLDYARLGRERFSDLMVVSAACHRKLHAFIERMYAKGFDRQCVLARLKPYCIRKILKLHDFEHDYRNG